MPISIQRSGDVHPDGLNARGGLEIVANAFDRGIRDQHEQSPAVGTTERRIDDIISFRSRNADRVGHRAIGQDASKLTLLAYRDPDAIFEVDAYTVGDMGPGRPKLRYRTLAGETSALHDIESGKARIRRGEGFGDIEPFAVGRDCNAVGELKSPAG